MSTNTASAKPAKLEDQIRQACRVRHYSLQTERIYVAWYKAFVRWAGLKHPATLSGDRVQAWLTHLATEKEVSASTQRQAKAAMPPRSQIDYYWPLAREACGLQHVRLHDIRHSTASEIIAAGGDLGDVGAVLNHKTPASSARYAHWLLARKAAVVGKIGRKVG